MSSKPKFLKETDISDVDYGKKLDIKESEEYYIIHNNGGRSMVVDVNRRKKKLRVFETVAQREADPLFHLKSGQCVIVFADYTSRPRHIRELNLLKEYFHKAEERYNIYCHPVPIFETRFSKLFVGHDVNPRNTYIKNPEFGFGNSVLVFTGTHYYSIRDTEVTKLTGIKGRVTGYVSEIGNNDVPYPMIFTTTHLYAACDVFYEFPLPRDKESRNVMSVLKRAKSPHDIPKEMDKAIFDFVARYQCVH